jgi:hypothetical protein
MERGLEEGWVVRRSLSGLGELTANNQGQGWSMEGVSLIGEK